MTFPESPQARLLVVVQEHPLRKALLALFAAEGYAAKGVATLEEALKEVGRQSYELILADLVAGISRHSFAPANLPRRRVPATPLGLLSSQPKMLAAPQNAGFAFALSRPVDVSLLLTEIAACLQPAQHPEEQQTWLIKRFLEAWGLQEWKSLLALCTDEIICYPPAFFTPPGVWPVQGKLAFLGLLSSFRGRYQSMRIEVQGVYERPRGLAVRMTRWVAERGKGWDVSLGTALVAFAGERICQMGIPLDAQQWQAFLELPPGLWRSDLSS